MALRDARGGGERVQYDLQDRPVRVEGPGSEVLESRYDAEGNLLEVKGFVKTENVVAGVQRDQNAYIAITLVDEQRRQLEPLLVGPFTGTSSWHEETKVLRIPPESREGIIRVGLFGATGTVAFDKVEMKKVTKP